MSYGGKLKELGISVFRKSPLCGDGIAPSVYQKRYHTENEAGMFLAVLDERAPELSAAAP